ncbi:GntR family transcriptional regulator [Paracoccus sp. MBLB3053]|uniref:GntR family transcriptional regulator n=1 Tax=Paracoccus aurantius TaxID=3073814 RepID=A0ABU2HY39_9RHOB|nr:GntR family transcriptional regulator [Paracoccus sp. MBLB3053]MDS9469972.1 GntR family transcriptional regulator [Paracoccus sp. MBLB3053]
MDLSNETVGALRVDKATLHDQVVARIRDLIVEGALTPGSRIDEAALIEQLGVSRTPFREALRTLAAEGLVEIRPTRGSLVRKLTPDEVFSMLEVLARLEQLAAELACKRATDAQIDRMMAIHAQMLDYYEKRERMPYFKLNQEFHRGIVSLSDNPVLVEIHGNLHARLKRIRFVGNRGPDFWADAVSEHEEMADALRARDGARLGEIAARHLLNTWTRVKDAVT